MCEIRDLDVWRAQQLLDADFRVSSVRELTGGGSASHYLRQVALESVIAERMRVRAVISMHQALLSGVVLSEIAHVTGSSREHLARVWRAWADGQRRLNSRYPGLGLDQHEYDRAAVAIGEADSGEGGLRSPMLFTQCACPVTSTQIGSPRP